MKNQPSIHEYIITISSCFINTNIPFCIAGGIAVSLWGHVRATEDLDVIALIDETHEIKLISALENHFKVIHHKDKMLQSSLTPVKRYVIILNSFHFVLDILVATNDFLKRCIQNRKLFSVKGINIPVINLEDLIVLTCASGRYQDIADVQALLAGSFPIDRDYSIKQLDALQVTLAPDIQKIILQ